MNVIGIDQIAIAVTNIERSIEFYQSAFGLTPVHREHFEAAGAEEVEFAIGGVRLQLLGTDRSDTKLAAYLATRGPGLHHVGFRVESIAGAFEHLRRRGIPMLNEGPIRGGGGASVGFVHPRAADGVLIEVVEPCE